MTTTNCSSFFDGRVVFVATLNVRGDVFLGPPDQTAARGLAVAA